MNFKQLQEGELRFIARAWDKKLWGIYDKARGSWPGQTPELGIVPQELESKEAAEEIADRLNKDHPVVAAASTLKKAKKKKTEPGSREKSSAKAPAADPAAAAPVPAPREEEIVAYDIDEEKAKKYAEGLF